MLINECYSEGNGSMDELQAARGGHPANITRDGT